MSPPLPRRALLAALAAPLTLPAAAPAIAAPPSAVLLSAWADFRRGFMLPEGRVVDNGNGGVSHSEGQGWAMFCAERCGDRASFDTLWNWTRQVLRRPGDQLLAWRFLPGTADPVPDHNNAADGDLFTAAALLLAGRRWAAPEYAEAGAAIARDVLRLLVREVADLTVLLPGAQGFEEAEAVVLNPSYYAFPVLGVLARAVPDPAWLRLAGDGLVLLRRARFGRWDLPPDWLVLGRKDGALALPGRWPPRFSYDALRIPLYLRWAGLEAEPAAQAAIRFWRDPSHPALPAWADLLSQRTAPYPAPAGVRAVAEFVSDGGLAESKANSGGRGGDYYSAILKMLILSTFSAPA
ncbi:glycosyl hydrolase family 8 [Roseomonas sp. E05]|uniref:glycosyl hydrolase family 8 n=1 Tax=Roseomonas sp. E05 TaxID=3046310 RepID=UPI0024B96137|nr:glycosyl hydrolase family 8 [Roseomonas sp. E05]MDJ0388677.1 glycosyl hydrolase family 8 [Roseomonas sp. E05]